MKIEIYGFRFLERDKKVTLDLHNIQIPTHSRIWNLPFLSTVKTSGVSLFGGPFQMSPRRGSHSDVESSTPVPVPAEPSDGIYKAVVEGSPQMTEIWDGGKNCWVVQVPPPQKVRV